jgi:hypothetical protein
MSSPGSPTATNGTKAPKDRACPFCGQAFTSSSLGRHLDLYIKLKNPKPADGIHDVDEIKKLRGGITRRQPRTSMKGAHAGTETGASSSDAPNIGSHNDHGRSESVATSNITTTIKPNGVNEYASRDDPTARSAPANEGEPAKTVFNSVNWLTTGVINNLPPRSTARAIADTNGSDQAQRMQDMRRNLDGSRISRPDFESGSMLKLQEAAELGRAAEMALREVLGSLEAAQKRTEPTTLFADFDFFSLSFPGLCLAVLPAPRTLFCVAPFPSDDSWSIGPPGLQQLEALEKCLCEKAESPHRTEFVTDEMLQKHRAHLAATWDHWQTMSGSEHSSAWNLEILRSFHHAQERAHNLQSKLETAQQRTLHLETEYDRLSRCQLPRDYLNHPPNTVPISSVVMRSFQAHPVKSDAAENNYDAEALIAKWRASIKVNTRPYRAPAASHTVSTPREAHQYTMGDHMVINGSVWGINGPISRDEALSHQNHESASVSYETPPEPGVVIAAEDADALGDVEESSGDRHDGSYNKMDIDAEAEGLAKSHRGTERGNRSQRTAPLRRAGEDVRSAAADSAPAAGANANGKRPLASTTANGRGNKAHKTSNADAIG